jgi:23S rRNA (adenine2503-C2)-methyltransferase
MKVDLKDLDAQEMEEWAIEMDLDAYRGRQIRRWLFQRLAKSFYEMTDLPKSLRPFLNNEANISHLKVAKTLSSEDGTLKYLFQLNDGMFIESVLIPAPDHYTLCISSQVGCGMGCRFCLTARQGFRRNLSPAEIIEQVIEVKRSMLDSDRLTNIVLMGMGEPLANYDNVLKAIRTITGTDGLNFSHRKVTLSTCGLIPQMKMLGRDIVVNLAVSLNAADNATRDLIMPINKRYPMEMLLSACRDFPLPNRRMITFEYVLIKDINDRIEDAIHLTKHLSNIRAKINLIPLNSYPHLDMYPPSLNKILRFQKVLTDNHFTAIIRKSKGNDILAACGQLSGLGQNN